MYVDVKMSKKGEIVVPAFVREKFGLKPGGSVRFEVTDESAAIVMPKADAVAWFRETAKKYGIPANQIVYGDKLYEEGIR